MKIMITGARGQLGRALQAELKNTHLVALGHADLDITRKEHVIRAVEQHQPDVVINAAAFNDVDGAEAAAAMAFRLNVHGPENLAIATQAHGISLVHVSTDYVFDGRARRPYHEFDRTNPLSAYGVSKLAGEQAVAENNFRHYIVRTAWLYDTQGKNFPRTMLSLSNRNEVKVVSDRFGSPTYAPHLAKAIIELIVTEDFGTYHLAGRGEASWFTLTEQLFRHFGVTTRVKAVPGSEFKQAARRPEYSVLKTKRIPPITLPTWQEGLQQFASEMLRQSQAHTFAEVR